MAGTALLTGTEAVWSPALRAHRGAAPRQQNPNPPIQRHLPGLCRPEPLPVLLHAAPFSATAQPIGHTSVGPAARSAAGEVAGWVPVLLDDHLGSGFGSRHSLRASAGSTRRLQSQTQGAPLVSPAAVLRGPPPRVRGRGQETGSLPPVSKGLILSAIVPRKTQI